MCFTAVLFHFRQEKKPRNVLNDIGSMLEDLTTELDAMLEVEVEDE